MLRIVIQDQNRHHVLKLVGNVAGRWVEELRRAWEQCTSNWLAVTVTVDCSRVAAVDSAGREILRQMVRQGALLRGPNLKDGLW